jgi:hypothetical protein
LEIHVMKRTILALAVALCAQGFAVQASAATLSFESLASADDNTSVGRTYVEQGFKLDDITMTSAYGFATWGSSNMFFSGSTALMNNNDAGITRLTQVGGGAFNLASVDLTVMYPGLTGDGNVAVTFTGTKLDNSTVMQSFNVNDGAPQTFTFTGFTNLASVSWADNATYHQFDNINVAAVPEPETYAMFLAGLGLMGFVARRRIAAR